MGAYMNLNSIKGESTDANHQQWIIIENASKSIHRSIPEGAKDQQRSRGNTTCGDVVVTRQMDATSTKLSEASANGTFFPQVQIDFCTQVKNKQEPYYSFKLKNVIMSNYTVNLNESGNPIPTETVTLAYTDVEWNYVKIDPKTGENKGNVPGRFSPGASTS